MKIQHNKTQIRSQASLPQKQFYSPSRMLFHYVKMERNLFPKTTLLLMLCLWMFSFQHAHAAHFFWMLEVYPEGIYGPSLRFPVPEKGTLYQSGSWNCTSENGWRDVNGWMLIESRSVVCLKKGAVTARTLQLLCREHESAVSRSEQRREHKTLLLEPERPGTSIFLRLSCMPLSMRLQ